jgi:integrase
LNQVKAWKSLQGFLGCLQHLTAGERDAFVQVAEENGREIRSLCRILAYAGYRLLKALTLTVDGVDLAAGTLIFETMKKRQGSFRSVPVPPTLLKSLYVAHCIRQHQAQTGNGEVNCADPRTGWQPRVTERLGYPPPRHPQRGCATVLEWARCPPTSR